MRAYRAELHDGAVVGEHDPGCRHAGVSRQLRVRGEHPVLAVDRHHRPRAQQRQHRAQLLGAGVARDVHGGDLLVQHLGADAREPVDRVVHAQLVPRHGLGGDDHRVATFDRDVRVVVVGDPRQRRHRLALAAGAEDQHLVGRQIHRRLWRDDRIVGDREVAEVPRDVHVLPHRAADHRDLAPALDRDVGGLLHAVDVRGERRDEDPALAHRHQRAERLADESLRARHAGPLGVRRVAEQEVDAAVADLRQPAHVGLEAVDRRVVELPVARVHDSPGRRLHHDRDRIGDRVRDAHELEAEAAELERRAFGVGLEQLRDGGDTVLLELRADEAERQARRDDALDVHLAEDVRQRADVVLVAVRQHDGEHAPALEVGEVGQHEVDAQVLVAREREARVDDDHVVAELVDGHVLADLAEPAERNDAQGVTHRVGVYGHAYAGRARALREAAGSRTV